MSLVFGLQRGEFGFAPLMDSEAYRKLQWSRGLGREEEARSDCLVESNGSKLEVRPQRLPCPPACLLGAVLPDFKQKGLLPFFPR